MNITTFRAFVKEASILQNVGMRIMRTAKAIPGHIRGGIQNAGSTVSAFSTPIDSLKRGVKATFSPDMPAWQKSLAGIGLVTGAAEVAPKEDPLRQGRSRFERATTAVGDQVGGLIGAPFGLVGGIVGSQIGRKAGMLTGKGAEGAAKLLKRKKEEPAPALP